ncbi:hypothetical protein [Tateyamaria omphalii]|uniref:Uncharacterized protein n=1 Tax=Tateyamaria omphalii TaxID=299262 RepID=A0A1P8MW64_9RHOB|nr:hypothetical protein [Tateyamaria omphalii]APX12304.1 hypothetical protein BWR18_11920 [Tateyamaria omphalii]
MTSPTFLPGEVLLHSWTISKRSYLVRVCAIAGIWVFIGLLGDFGKALWLILLGVPASAVIVLFNMWVFGELDVWRRHRNTQWYLTNEAIHISANEDFAPEIPLDEIKRINRWPFWSLVVRFENGTAMTLPIPQSPRDLRRRILHARDEYIARLRS